MLFSRPVNFFTHDSQCDTSEVFSGAQSTCGGQSSTAPHPTRRKRAASRPRAEQPGSLGGLPAAITRGGENEMKDGQPAW
eukprot:912158-Prorocentrum_minimum.AAC.3